MRKLDEYYKKKVIDIYEFVDRFDINFERIVFTNGCFDVMHVGHINLLLQAKELGDILVVGINSDESISRLKKEKDVKRPIHNLYHRCLFLSSLPFVDYIIPFEEDNPARLLEVIQPDVFVKGGEYDIKDSIAIGMGTKILDVHGIKYVPIPTPIEYIDSSTEILKKLTENEKI